ncbi:MAG: hypothetical protein KIT24_04905 [Phycisphaeraceae bacterium]|nr:hypothetical protein [Phycisphaeraceae bacterium]
MSTCTSNRLIAAVLAVIFSVIPSRAQIILKDLEPLNSAIRSSLQNQDVFRKMNEYGKNEARQQGADAELRCIIVSPGALITRAENGRITPAITYFLYTYWHCRGERQRLRINWSEAASIHILTAVTLVPIVDQGGKVSIKVITETAADRRLVHGAGAPSKDVAKKFVRSAAPGIERKVKDLLHAQQSQLEATIHNMIPGGKVPANSHIVFTSDMKDAANNFAFVGVRSVNLGNCTPANAALVVTLAVNDVMLYRVIYNRVGFASDEQYRQPWSGWVNDRPGRLDREDLKNPGWNSITLYLPSNYDVTNLRDDLGQFVNGRNWNDQAATVWIQPGPNWSGEHLLLTDTNLREYDKRIADYQQRVRRGQAKDSHVPLHAELSPGFYSLLLSHPPDFKRHLHERVAGLRTLPHKGKGHD